MQGNDNQFNFIIQGNQCEEFDLEKVLKQITPELPERTHVAAAGEFSRFRRSRILSASEEKSLIDENNDDDADEGIMGAELADNKKSDTEKESDKVFAKSTVEEEKDTNKPEDEISLLKTDANKPDEENSLLNSDVSKKSYVSKPDDENSLLKPDDNSEKGA